MTHTVKVTPSGCPVCFAKLDAATKAVRRKPKPGDIGICVYCATLLRYEPDLTMRQLTEEEFQKLAPDFQAGLREMQALYKKDPVRRGSTHSAR